MSWSPKPELFELVTWADVEAGNHVWYMGNVMLIRDGEWSAYYDPDHGQYPLRPGLRRVPVRDETGNEFAPPVELTDRVTRLLPPGHGITENDARAALPHDIYNLQQDMLHRGEDITDNRIWKPAKREFLRWIIYLAHRELHQNQED
jgi:hypothetical protein